MVADWCIPKILAEVKQYVGYLKDIQTMRCQLITS